MDNYTSGWDKFIKLGNNEISLDGSSDNLNLDIKAKGNGLISIGTNNGTPLIVNSTTVGIGTNPTPEYTLNVNGTLNCHSLVVNEHSVTGGNGGFLWDTENGTNNIYYNLGKVGIGNINPYYKLDFGTSGGMLSVYNNNGNYLYGIDADNYGSGYGLNFYASAGGKAEGNIKMKIHRDTGNVGIGTTSPEQKLDVRGGMRLGNGTSAEQYISYYNNIGNWRTGINNSGNGTSANQFYIYDNDYRLTVQKGTGNVGIGTRLPEQKLDVRGAMRLGNGTSAEQYIAYYNNIGNWRTGINNSGNGTSANQFYIYDNDYRLTVQKGTGNVGIGTRSPEQKLDVRGGGGMRLGDGTSAEQYISYYNNTGDWRTGINNYGNGTSGNQFYIYDNDYRLTVQKDSGYVGIGTSSPQQKLDVRGDIRAINFIGNGSELTHINANNISSGFINNSILPSDIAVTSISGDGSGLTNINANNITAGVLSIDKGGTNANTAENARNNLGIITTFQLNGTDVYYNDGNVGIGTSTPNPNTKLDVNGDIGVKDNIYIGDDSSTLNTIDFGNDCFIQKITTNHENTEHELFINSGHDLALCPGRGGIFFDINSSRKMTLSSEGAGVGIGESYPAHTIDFGTSGGTISLYHDGSGNNFYGLDTANFGSGMGINFYASTGGKAESNIRMKIDMHGQVGIGTTSPAEKLDVNGSIRYNGQLLTSSDSRIKYDISDLDDNEMLNKLMLIEPKKYKYKDKSKGNAEVYGFMAQQVKDIMGDFAVKLNKGYIYDINNVATINSNIITSTSNLELSSNYQIIINNCEKNVTVDEILEDNRYKISGYDNNSNISQDIFIQGKLVDDFHLLNKTAIFTMNVGATQELYKIVQSNQDTITNLINRIEILESKIN